MCVVGSQPIGFPGEALLELTVSPAGAAVYHKPKRACAAGMRPCGVVLLLVACSGTTKSILSVSLAPSGFARRGINCFRDRQHTWYTAAHVGRVRRRGRTDTSRRRCRGGGSGSAGASVSLHASLPPTSAGLPSLDGLPGAQQSHGGGSGGGGRSRRGKYPVIELYRRDTGSGAADACDGSNDKHDHEVDSVGDGLHPQAAARSARGKGLTAMDHLRSVLRLGPEQADVMLESFPALADVHPDKLDLPAKLRFLRHTIGGDGAEVAVCFPQFFGHPLERHIAPRHAFLVASGRPSGARLLEGGCRGLRRMLELPANRFVAEMVPGREMSHYRRFEQAFLRGPFDAARKGDAETLRLLRTHGWDCWETDRRDRTALFWAAGGGSVDACAALIEGEGGLHPRDSGGDGSTPLHWAAAGVETRRFGTGGHVDVCRWLLGLGADPGATTSEGNTVVMWAAWAGGLEATRWVVEEAGADLDAANANGCTVAHWAASGGDEAVCRYLHSKGVDFARRNNGGNDPLNHAVAYGRRDIAAWLLGADGGRDGEMPPLSKDADNVARQSGVEEAPGAAARAVRPVTPGRGRRRRDDPQLLDLARLTGDKKMQAFLLEGK